MIVLRALDLWGSWVAQRAPNPRGRLKGLTEKPALRRSNAFKQTYLQTVLLVG